MNNQSNSATMSDPQIQEALQAQKNDFIKSNIVQVITTLMMIIIAGLGFYFNTNSRLTQHEEQIQQLSTISAKQEEAIANGNIGSSVSNVQIKNLEDRMNSMEQTMKETYNMLITISQDQKTLLNRGK